MVEAQIIGGIPENLNIEGIKKIGQTIVEHYEKKGVLKEKLGISKEDLTLSGNTILYTTAVASFIEKRLRPQLVVQNVIKAVTVNLKGVSSMKIPLRSALITAQEIGDNGEVAYDTGNYSGQTVNIKWIYAANKISYTLLQQSNVDLMANELGEIGDALGRKIDSDIVAAFESVSSATLYNNKLTGSSTASYSDLVTAYTNALNNYAIPDTILTDPAGLGYILSMDEIIRAMQFNTPATPTPSFLPLLHVKLVVSPLVGSKQVYFIDSQRTGYLLRGSNVVTWDGRVNASVNFEVIGAIAYGVGIVQPKSIYNLDWSSSSAPA